MLRAVHLKDNDFIFTSYRERNSGLVFYKIDISNGHLEPFEHITNAFDNTEFGWWKYDGYFVKGGKSSLFYITNYTNDFLKFTTDGKLEYKSKLIHNTPMIVLKSNKDGLVYSVNDFPSNIGASTDKDALYVLSGVLEKKDRKDERIIDLYSTSDGKYMYSFRIPYINGSPILGISVFESQIFILYEALIGIFSKDK